MRNSDNSLIIRSLRFLKQIDTKAIVLGKLNCYLLTYILILEVLQPYRMLKECQLKYILQDIVLYTYKLQLANVHSALILIQSTDTRKNKSKYNVILKIRFHGSVRVAEGSNDRLGIYLEGFRTP